MSTTSSGPVRVAGRPHAAGSPPSPLARLLGGLVRAYRATAPLRGGRCRFHPTCSAYALEAIERHGAVPGVGYTLRRLLRCHPWNPGGVDHVPTRTPR